MEFVFVIFLLSSTLLGNVSGSTTQGKTTDMTEESKKFYTTAADHSCMFKCGYNFGACSCESSCRYYGTCCRDYYDYCSSTIEPTTQPPATTTVETPIADYISCRDRCGYDGGICSCSSSCQYYGHCCHDYYYYCSSTTITPTTANVSCGGHLTQQQGQFFSPNYPYNYPNNARCTWTLMAGDLQVVSLNFTSVSLESCCDFIRVYDGPNSQSAILGTATGNWVFFNSSSRYLTVVFSTDGSVTQRGFRAEWTFKSAATCQNRCGYNNGVCSCESSCVRYGRCCHDYYNYCSSTSVTPTPATSTCQNRCGYNNGVCSCESSCVRYGRCCHDYYNYCSSTSVTPTPATSTCQNRCGYNNGVCSCESSCVRYGRCCHDYYNYCSSTSVTPTPATSTCQNRCGYNNGVCSCESSCVRYGRCCHDYYNYCSSTSVTPTPDVLCGGNLTQQQGQFFSPNYPYNYPNNARCTWTLMAGDLQVVSLNFTSVSLESCCDFIRVYDGPNSQSAILGTATGNGVFFNSSSRYLTVVFSTDSSATQRGFRAEWTFKSAPMCKNRCGSSNSRCSCESSCVRYGRCCHDYHEFCDYVTSPPLPVCGGNYNGSGSMSSPYYPGYYHDNAQCVWRLSAPAGQTIFLSFLDLDLERCCNCDYVNVYDGSSTASPLIGKLCHNTTSHMDFQSSSSYLTVQFRSDYSGVGRGFKAYFSSSLNQNTGRVDCSSERMNIAISKSYLDSMGFNWNNLYLDDHSCRASSDYYYVTFNFPLHSCSTQRKTQNGRIIYTNNVRAAQSTSGEITRTDTHFLMFVSCVMERESSVGTLYEAKEITNATISGTGRFNTTMAFYTSSSFSYPINEFPYRVTLNQELYIQVQLTRAEPSLHLFIDSCIASPNHDYTIRTYDLIRNGCRRDSTVNIYRNGNRYFAQFSFRAFKFLRTHTQVFLRCDLVICADDDYNSRCRQGCRNRRKRSLSHDHHTEVVTLGPITLKGPEEAEEKAQEEE